MTKPQVTMLLISVAVGCGITLGAQSRAKETGPALTEFERSVQRQIARDKKVDGLGEQIIIEAPPIRMDGPAILERTIASRGKWFHLEARYGNPPMVELRPVEDSVSATWRSDGTGRLTIVGRFGQDQCRFDGVIAADRVTVTGDAQCGDRRETFRARLVQAR